MGLVVVAAALSLAVGLAAGRRLRTRPYRLRSSWLVVTALALQVAGALLWSGPAYPLTLLASAAFAGGFVLRNINVPGLSLIGVGLVAKALVVVLNGAMPVSLRAAELAGLDEFALNLGADPRHELIIDETLLPWLGDVVPVPLLLRPEVVSPGDLLVAAGVGLLFLRGVLGRRLTRSQGQSPDRMGHLEGRR